MRKYVTSFISLERQQLLKRFNRLLVLCCMLVMSLSARAGFEPTKTNKKNLASFTVGDSLITSVNLVNNDTHQVHHTWNRITLSVCTDTNLCYTDSFTFTAFFEARYWDIATNTYHFIDTITLSVSYNPVTGRLYTEKNTFAFENAYKVSLIPLSYSSNTLNARVCVYNEIDAEHWWNMAYFLNDSITFSAVPAYQSSSNEYLLTWQLKDWAEEYDLEWTWVDDYDGEDAYKNASDCQYNFRFNSGRVTVKDNTYRINSLFEHGYVIFRIRGVGYGDSDHKHRISSSWSLPYTSKDVLYVKNNYAKYLLTIDTARSHKPYLNWQYMATYAEEGKKKEVISYFDGSLRNRQSVTKINSDTTAIVGESFYDYQGRPAVSSLPVPSFSAKLSYYGNFTVNEFNQPYDKDYFDPDSSGVTCVTRTGRMDTTTGASRYYSANNPYKNAAHHAYIPDAMMYPFTQVEYTPDNTGRIARQGGVGKDHQLGSGHETMYFYGTPDSAELIQLFGTNVGSFEHYRKNMVRDANGQMSISYLDAKGKVIATALAGNNPANVQSLSTNQNTTVHTTLLAHADSIRDESELVMNRTILVSADNSQYKIKYSLQGEKYTPACIGSNTCYDCVYDLEISLRDRCGNEKLPGGNPIIKTIGRPFTTGHFDTICHTDTVKYSFRDDSIPGYMGGTNNEYFLVTLDAGEYQLVKTLKINQAALDYYTNKYIEQGLRTGCLIDQDSFVRQAYQHIDTTSCEMDCAQCRAMVGADTTFRRQYMTALIEEGRTPIAYDTTKADSIYQVRLKTCDVYCDTVDPCRAHYYIMLSHVSPGGHFALITSFSPDSNYVFADKYTYSIFGIHNAPADTNGFLMQSVVNAGLKFDTVMVKGVRRAITDLTATELFFNWQPDWARILVKIHPEYCQYLWCQQNKASYQYDQDMLNTPTYQAALDSGYLNPLGSTGNIGGNANVPYSLFTINHKDPYFDLSANSTQKASFKTDLEQFYSSGGSHLSAWELMISSNCAAQTNFSNYYSCVQGYFINEQLDCDDSVHLDKYWNFFRGMYLSKKQLVLETYRTTQTACSTGAALVRWQNWIVNVDHGGEISFAFPTQSDALLQMGVSDADKNSTSFNSNKARNTMKAACDSQCTGYASRWMQQLGGCAFNTTTDSTNFRNTLIGLCKWGCDANNPLGASSVAPKYKSGLSSFPVGSHTYAIYSFKDAFNAYVAEGKIITTGNIDSVRKCNIDVIDMPGKYRHDYYLTKNNPLNFSAADTFATTDSMSRQDYDVCTCSKIKPAFILWKSNAELQSCYDSVYKYINHLYGVNLTEKQTRAFMDACTFPPGGGGGDDCHKVIIPFRTPPGYNDTDVVIPKVIRIYSAYYGDTVWAVEYPADTVILPKVPLTLICGDAENIARCFTCETAIASAIDFIETYGGAPDTAYALPALYANILNRDRGFNLSYYEFTRFLNACDTVYKILYAVNYKTVESTNALPQFSESLNQQVDMNFPGGAGVNSDIGTCACNKMYTVYLTWLDLKNKDALPPAYQNFKTFAAANGLVFDPDEPIESILAQCKGFVSIDSLVTRTIVCADTYFCTNGVDTIWDCTDPMGIYWADTLTTCDTSYVFNYCKIEEKLPGPKKACMSPVLCDYIADSLAKYPDYTTPQAETYLKLKWGGEYTVIKASMPLDPDTCQSNCTRAVFAVCGSLSEAASDYFELLNSLALMDTLDADSFDLNTVFAFRKSSFNRSLDKKNCDGNGNKDPYSKFDSKAYPSGTIENDSTYSYVFVIGRGYGQGGCRVYLDSLTIPALDSISQFFDVRPTTVSANGRQYFSFKVLLHDSDTIVGRGHTDCFMVSACCPPTIKLCNKPLITQVAWESPCKASLKNAAIANGKKMYEMYIDSVRTAFRLAWTNKCLQGGRSEVMEMEYSKREYHYTLYYYDQAGNLVQTVPPAGVATFNPTQIANAISIIKNYPDSVYQPAHTLPTVYHYNSLNQLIWQRTPDADTNDFFYDRLGRLTFSQNKKQKNGSTEDEIKYSYTVYDPLGRITEVGELRSPYSVTHAASRRQTFVTDSALAGTRSEITKTWYDAVKYTISNGSFAQHQLRGRVAHITYQDASGSSYQHGVHYSYDIHGNVNSMVRENVTLTAIGQQYKQIDYDYDLVSGKVNQVNYQQGGPDQFYHRYDYDADNRLTQAYTSTDSVHWDRDARYFYYLHGPLARTEIGQHKVQGVDYAYTLHGWLKGVNSGTLNETRDMGKDGWVSGANTNRNVARDVYGFTLSYYNTSSTKDYTAVNDVILSAANGSFEANLYNKDFGNASPSLYNGNIKSMGVAIAKFMEGGATPVGYAYQYDQLNRLLQVDAYNNINCSTNTWNTGGSALPDYHNRFTYDANGNILTQVRRGNQSPFGGGVGGGSLALDSLTYHYASNKNQLTYVDDAITGSAYSDDIDDQSSGNYEYDEIGNLIGDAQEQIDSIEWTVYGKIKRITRTNGSLKPDLEFEYSPDGHRVCKIVKPKIGTHIWTYTYYVRDAQGNIMATYDRTLEAIFDPEQTNYEDVNNELLSLNGSGMFQGFIFGLHPEVSSADFIDSLQQALLSSDLSHQLQFINAMAPYKSAAATDLLTTNSTAYNYVLSQLGDQEFTEAFLAEFGKSDLFSNICTYDLNFINTCVGYDYTTYLTNFATYIWSDFDQMHYDIMGFHEYGLVNAVNNLSTHQSDVISWILLNGSCTRNTIVCSYFSNGDINGILNSYGYGNCRTAIMNQYSTGSVIYVLINGSFSFNVWNYLCTNYTSDILNFMFSNYASQSYTALVLSNPELVAPVQTANYYYSKTDYFDEIKTIYGQYTYDVLVGKFITLSNQFNDVFTLSEWHLYGSSRLGIQKPKHNVTLSASEESAPYGDATGRELVHISFQGTWSSYQINYADTDSTTITTYQMSYDYFSLTRGEKNYELVNHLGNVLVVISDKKLKTCEGDTVNYYTADVLQATDYSAFGVILKGREYYADTTGKYRMGFNGKENDSEVEGDGNWQEYGMRMYSPRLGRFPNVDPISRNYPMLSPYPFAANSPIIGVDIDGLELQPTNSSMYRLKFVADYGLKPFSATETKRHVQITVVIIHKNVPPNYKFGNLSGKYVGTDGKDGVYPNGVIDVNGKIILFGDDGSPSTYPTVKNGGKGGNKFTYVGQQESVNGNGFVSMVGAAEMIRDAIGFASVYNELLANEDEARDRLLFYMATNIVEKYIKRGFFNAADETFRTGAGRVDVINYINDGTLPAILTKGTKEQIEQSKAYQKLIVAYGNEILRREGIPYTDPTQGPEPVPLVVPVVSP